MKEYTISDCKLE